MLKWLAILAVILAIAQTPMPIIGQASDNPCPNNQKQNDGTENGKRIAKPSRPSITQDLNSQNERCCPAKAEPQERACGNQYSTINIPDLAPMSESWTWHDIIAWVADLALALFGLIGILIGLGSLYVIWEQGSHIIKSERAWLLPDGEKIGMPVLVPVPAEGIRKIPVNCSIGLTNCGNTPAFAVKWEFELRIGESKENPPSFDIYKNKSTPSMEGQTPFPIGQGRHGHAIAVLKPHSYISLEERLEINDGRKIIWLCGVARYRDVFKHRKFLDRNPEEHETLICLRYEARSDGSSGAWMLGGPSGYNRAT